MFDPPPSLDGLGGRPSAPQVASHRGRCVGCARVCVSGCVRRTRRGFGPGRHSGRVPRRGQGCGRPFVHLLQAGVPRHHVEAPPRAGNLLIDRSAGIWVGATFRIVYLSGYEDGSARNCSLNLEEYSGYFLERKTSRRKVEQNFFSWAEIFSQHKALTLAENLLE